MKNKLTQLEEQLEFHLSNSHKTFQDGGPSTKLIERLTKEVEELRIKIRENNFKQLLG